MRREHFVSKVTLCYKVTLEATRPWWSLHVKNKMTVLFTDSVMDTGLPAQRDCLVRLTLATCTADDHVDVSVMLAKVIVQCFSLKSML